MSARPVLIVAACAAGFVAWTGSTMPAVVASHFSGSGAANGYMPRALYLLLMLVFVVVLPLVLAFVPGRSLNNPRARFNVPNRDYWLAPEHREEAVALVRRYIGRFGIVLAVFLCYVHWLVVRANAVRPPVLSSLWLIGGLAVFAAAMLWWAQSFIGSFRSVPGRGRAAGKRP